LSQRNYLIPLALGCLALFLIGATLAPSEGVGVRAVLFYSPTCPHCQIVREESLPPLQAKYGDQLQILEVDVTQPGGQELFIAAIQKYNLDGGVPTLIVGDQVLVGSIDIPEKFPALIEQYLSRGGIDWPAIPGLPETLAAQSGAAPEASSNPASTAPAKPTSLPASLGEKLKSDLPGNVLAIIVLAGMLATLTAALLRLRGVPTTPVARSGGWLVPVLCLAGLGVAGYLSYVETAQVRAVCGPVGDCNAVQQSAYARLFGVLPVGILGMAGYLAILPAWLVSRLQNARLAAYASLAMLGMTAFGTLFSIYLTFLEPFVIGATCAWCLTSAVIITALFWFSLPPGWLALTHLAFGRQAPIGKKRRPRKSRPKTKPVANRKRLIRQRQKTTWVWIGLGLAAIALAGWLLLPKSPPVTEISAAQAYQKYQQGAFFLDVRGLEEWNQGHIADSTLIPLAELPSRLDELPTDQDIVVVCQSGLRSKEGVVTLLQAGFKRASCLKGGLKAWVAAGYPLEVSPP